jgi:hypothetical protein
MVFKKFPSSTFTGNNVNIFSRSLAKRIGLKFSFLPPLTPPKEGNFDGRPISDGDYFVWLP